MIKKLLVVSDSHGNTVKLEKISRGESPFDIIIHCGDGVMDLLHVNIPKDSRVIRVSGNIDRAGGVDIDRAAFISIEGCRFMVTHGDAQRVHNDYSGLYNEARERGVDVVLFGHTHKSYLSGGKPVLFNPGPALSGHYGIIMVGDTIEFYHRRLED